jgi:hypothetical protein
MMFLFQRARQCLVLPAVMLFAASAPAWAGSVTISSPGSGSTVSSPVRVVASASSSSAITLMQVYVDGSKVYQVNAAKIDKSLSMTSGTRRVAVQAYDSGGNIFKQTVYVTVSGSTTTTGTTSSSAKTFYNIDQMTGWKSCSACAGTGGDGPVAKYWMKQGISSPSMDGKSTQFFLGGSTPYANALWWKQLGANDAPANFVYDLYYYIKTPSAAQALEFDVNHARLGKRFIFGTECDFKHYKVWKVYDPYNRKWRTTSIPCPVPKAYAWHRVTLEFRRADGKAKFVAVTINGNKHYFNRAYSPHSTSAREVNVAFQMDGNGSQTDYSVWLDKVTLKYW